jgi:hypothetical protein
MHFMSLTLLSDFMQVLNNIKKHSTKNEYFHKHIQVTTISLLQEHNLNHRNYYKQKINMTNFV